MGSANKTQSFSFPTYSSNNNSGAIEFDNTAEYAIDLPAVDPQNNGSLTTRTDDNTGVATLSAGHNITTGMVVDVYWATGVRYGMGATVSGNAVTIEGGAGDVLPVQSTAITAVCEQVEINPLNLDGDEAQFVAVIYKNAADQTAKAHIQFQDVDDDEIAEHDLVHETANGGHAHVNDIAGGDANPYTGDVITKGFASHTSTSDAKLYVLIGIDATP